MDAMKRTDTGNLIEANGDIFNDQLTVTKLRPMSEANRNDGESECLLFVKGFSSPYQGFWDETSWVLYAFDQFKSDGDFEGWIPMPIYKPEEK